MTGPGAALEPLIRVDVRQGSVTDADVDVLVNASNTQLRLGSGVSAAIRAACGPGYQAFLDGERARLAAEGRTIEPGDVVVTHAGAHPRARFVAHVAVMDYALDAEKPFPDLARIERASWQLWAAIAALPSSETLSVSRRWRPGRCRVPARLRHRRRQKLWE